MKWKLKQYPRVIYNNEFLIFPRKFEGYRYWWQWVTVKYTWFFGRYSRFGTVVSLGKQAEVLNQIYEEKNEPLEPIDEAINNWRPRL